MGKHSSTHLNDTLRLSLLEQIQRLANALELIQLDHAQVHSLYYNEIARMFGIEAAKRISRAVNGDRASSSSSSSSSPRFNSHQNNMIPSSSSRFNLPPNTAISPSSPKFNTPRNTVISPPSELYTKFKTKPGPSKSSFQCPICLESKCMSMSITPCNCGNRLCVDCLRTMLGVVADEKGNLPVRCPTCPLTLDTHECLRVLEGTKWYPTFSSLVTEKVHHHDIRYCANKQCGAPFDWVELPGVGDHPTRTLARCPLCNMNTCVDCRVLWHENQTCLEYQNNEADIIAVGRLAARMKWMPCPKCNVLIEKRQGDCNFVRCMCGCGFCFNCGVEYVDTKQSNGNSHGKSGCDCGLFENHGERRDGGRAVPPRIVVDAIREANRREFGDLHGGEAAAAGSSRKSTRVSKPKVDRNRIVPGGRCVQNAGAGRERNHHHHRHRSRRRDLHPRDRRGAGGDVAIKRRGGRGVVGMQRQISPHENRGGRHPDRLLLSDESDYSSDSSSSSSETLHDTDSDSSRLEWEIFDNGCIRSCYRDCH